MDTLYRQWLTLRMIPRLGRIASTEILSRLKSEYGIEPDLHTIQRDLVNLSRQFPLVRDSYRPAGWSWLKDAAAFDIPNMDPVAALTFKLAEQHIGQMLPHGVLTALKPYIKTADERLKQTSESNLTRWPDKVKVVSRSLAIIPPHVPEEISEAVYTALLKERRFTAKYRRIGGKSKEHEVNPLGMVFVEGLTYLVASLNEHTEPVLLLLHRIKSVMLLDKAATPPDGFKLEEYIARELKFPLGGKIGIRVLFDRSSDIQRLEEAPVALDQSISRREDGRFELTATIEDSMQLRWWLEGYGERVEVLEPEALREEFANMARLLAQRYSLDKGT